MVQYKDYYKVMGLERDATPAQIKQAYRRLARKYHPDVSKEPDAEERFKQVGEAYEVLKDPKKRQAYDRLGSDWQAGQEFRPPPGWQPQYEFHSSGFSGADAAQFSDFFEALFGQGLGGSGFGHDFGGSARRDFFAQGTDIHATVSIDIDDAYRGASRMLALNKTEYKADGTAQIKRHTLNVHIPKGVHQGQSIRLSGQGEAGLGKGKPGDLYLEIKFHPHPYYRVEGRDVYVELPVAPWELALGATVSVPTPTGKVDVKIPPGSGNGRKLRLKGRGIPGKPAGDLYVVLKLVLPPADNEQVKQAYKALEQAKKFNPREKMGV